MVKSDSGASVDIFGYAKNNGMFKELRRTEGISTTLMISRFLNTLPPFDACEPLSEDDTLNVNNHLKEKRKHSSARIKCLAERVLSVQDRSDLKFANATASRISRFFLPARSRESKRVLYLESVFDLFHVGYVDILNEIIGKELRESEGRLQSASDIFLILGILYKENSLQSLHERGISMLSLKMVDDVVLDVKNAPDKDFRRALGIDCIYKVEGHVDFKGNEKRQESYEEDGSEVKVLNAEKIFSSDTILKRVLESREELERRQEKKAEPIMAVAKGVEMIDAA